MTVLFSPNIKLPKKWAGDTELYTFFRQLIASAPFKAISEDSHRLPSYAVADVPDAGDSGAGAMIYITDETGGAVPAFSDGTDWRRVTDRAIVS